MGVGVVVPTLNEARYLPGLLEDLQQLTITYQLVVADGGSTDETIAVADSAGASVVLAPQGRGSQMNAGARVVSGNWLCFLHADVRLSPGVLQSLERTVGDASASAAVWRLAIDSPGLWYRTFELGALLRDRLGGLPYGDQGLLVRRELFEEVGGFPDIPVLEDVVMVRALRRATSLRRLPAAVRVSSRRWQREGPCRTWLRNTALVTAFLVGISPRRLARWYRPEGM
jgi:rSAM/selenodomain-associated transferase 2